MDRNDKIELAKKITVIAVSMCTSATVDICLSSLLPRDMTKSQTVVTTIGTGVLGGITAIAAGKWTADTFDEVCEWFNIYGYPSQFRNGEKA